MRKIPIPLRIILVLVLVEQLTNFCFCQSCSLQISLQFLRRVRSMKRNISDPSNVLWEIKSNWEMQVSSRFWFSWYEFIKMFKWLRKGHNTQQGLFWSLRNGKALLIKEMFWSNAIRLVSGIRMSLHWFTSNKDPRILLWASSTTTCSGSLPHRTYETRANYRTASWPSIILIYSCVIFF